MSSTSGSGMIISPGTDMLIRGLVVSGIALLVLNYYGLGGAASLTSTSNAMPAVLIGALTLATEMYLPRVEYWVESQY